MKKLLFILVAALLQTMPVGAQQPADVPENDFGNKTPAFAIDPAQPVLASDAQITEVRLAVFEPDSIRIVPADSVKPLLSRRRLSPSAAEIAKEGTAAGPVAILYSYNYPSVDADGNKVTLSSLMAVPTRMLLDTPAAPENLVIGCHVTITSNYESPTQYFHGGSWMSDVGMQLWYARYDFIRQTCCLVIMPDYEGYGVSKTRPHPYLYQELTARQVVDGVRYGLALYKANIGTGEKFKSFEDGWKSVCVGYSQGGSVSLATHRFIEENGLSSELHFAGSVCGDGPYDPIEHMLYYMTDNGETYDDDATEHRPMTVSMPIVMPLILKGMCDRNPFMRQHQVSDYLSEKFLRTGVIDFINAKSKNDNSKQYSTNDINDAFKKMRKNGLAYTYIDEKGERQHGSYSAAQMEEMLYKESGGNVHGKLQEILTPMGFNYFQTLAAYRQNHEGEDIPTPAGRGVMEDLHRALASNSLVAGWTPTHRIGFYHSSHDTVVPYVNLLSFIRHQDSLNYYFHNRSRSSAAGVNPSHIVSEGKADVYIIDDDSKKDHVDAGQDFYFAVGVSSPDMILMKWVLKGK